MGSTSPLQVRRTIALTGGIVLVSLTAGQTFAVEQHPAPVYLNQKSSRLAGDQSLAGSDDATSLGVNLSGILVTGEASSVGQKNVSGIDVESSNATLNDPALKQALSGFIGKPMSRKLVSDIRTSIVRYMRAKNRPLVAVIVPPQEVTGGTLRLTVVPFVVGDRKVTHLPTQDRRTEDSEVLDAVRVQTGEEVASDTLIEDLNWLNRSPFRKFGVVFNKGRLAGQTDLDLTVSDERPWRIFGGYSNGGTKATGYDRLYAGFVRELSWNNILSFQHTVSPETFYSGGQFYNFKGDKAYLSNSIGYTHSFENRTQLTITGAYIHSRGVTTNPFVQDSRVWQGGLDYSMPAPMLGPSSSAFIGLDAKRELTELNFGSSGLGVKGIQIYQLATGIRGTADIGDGNLDYYLKGVFSPGGLNSENSDAAFAALSGNSNSKSRYAYVNGRAEYSAPLPRDFSVDFVASGQYASGILPDLEKFAVGGDRSVRGYDTNEITGDNGVLLQAELHLPPLEKNASRLDFFSFADYGAVYNYSTSKWQGLFGMGLGVNARLTGNANLSLVWGHAFIKGPVTAGNSDRLHLGLNVSY